MKFGFKEVDQALRDIKLPPSKDGPATLIEAYQHIDNGGHTIRIDEYDNVYINTGFFGYSETTVMLSAVDLDSLITVLQTAKQRKSELEMVRKLRGD